MCTGDTDRVSTIHQPYPLTLTAMQNKILPIVELDNTRDQDALLYNLPGASNMSGKYLAATRHTPSLEEHSSPGWKQEPGP